MRIVTALLIGVCLLAGFILWKIAIVTPDSPSLEPTPDIPTLQAFRDAVQGPPINDVEPWDVETSRRVYDGMKREGKLPPGCWVSYPYRCPK